MNEVEAQCGLLLCGSSPVPIWVLFTCIYVCYRYYSNYPTILLQEKNFHSKIVIFVNST